MKRSKTNRKKSRYATLLIIPGLLIFVFLAGCASKLKKLEEMKSEGNDQEIVDSDIDCIDNSAKCFKIKLIRADSYLKMNNIDRAALYSEEAIDRINNGIPPDDALQAYLINSSALQEQLKSAEYIDLKQDLVRQIDKRLSSAEEVLRTLPHNEKNQEIEKNVVLQKIENLFLEMDLSDQNYLESIYQRLMKSVDALKNLEPDEGYISYFTLKVEYKSLRPEIARWMSGGKMQGDRERLLEQLKLIYKQALPLRTQPVYYQGYAGEIEQFLTDVDTSMKQLVL